MAEFGDEALTVWMGKELKDKIRQMANKDRRSMTGQVLFMLESYANCEGGVQ